MSNNESSPVEHNHSARSILISLGVAIVLGVVIVVTIVWPAEYGKDPTGIGALLGLTTMSAEERTAAEADSVDAAPDDTPATQVAALPDATSEKVVPITVPWPEQMEQAGADNIGVRQSAYSTDHIEVTLESGEGIEYKAVLSQGELLVFSWTTSGGEVYTDLHAEPEHKSDFQEKYWLRYDESEAMEGHGYIIAPFDGNHGWYWLNRNIEPLTVELDVSGFYSEFREIE
jgi:hypothetical protein